MASGRLKERVAFDQRAAQPPDAYGRAQAGFVERFWRRAEFVPRFGGESVMAARLQGRQPVTIRLRYDKQAAAVTTDWRLRDARTGTLYNIRSGPVDPDRRRQWLEFLCESGGDNG